MGIVRHCFIFLVFAGFINAATAFSADETAARPEPFVFFVIKARTGKKAWNDKEAPLLAHPGQVIRIINMDSTRHLLHSATPYLCNHQPGQGTPPVDMTKAQANFFDCKIPTNSTYDATLGVKTYDHYAGPSGAFYVKVVPFEADPE